MGETAVKNVCIPDGVFRKIPDHAVLHESVEIAKIRGHKGIASFVNGILRSMQRDGLPDLSLIKDPVERIQWRQAIRSGLLKDG